MTFDSNLNIAEILKDYDGCVINFFNSTNDEAEIQAVKKIYT